jgi:8-oxo-dGTP pyrophosphatase MutT (NUDIX family)
MAHIHEKIDYTATIYIVNGDAVLLRKHDKYKAWLAVGGHIELDEDPQVAAVREAKEEVGLDVTLLGTESSLEEGYVELLPPRFMNRHRINDTHEHIDFIFFGTTETQDVHPGEGESTEGIRWFKKDELDDPQYAIRKTIRHYAKSALEAAKK